MTIIPLQVPSEPFLLRLFELWQIDPKATVIRDVIEDKEYTREQFLYDILIEKERIYESLHENAKARLRDPEDEESVFIAIVAPAGYGFRVLLYAIYCLGAAALPLSSKVLPSEAKYFMETCNASLLAGTPKSEQTVALISSETGIKTHTFLPQQSHPFNSTFDLVTETQPINPEKGFVLLYSSGTTGPPKGTLHSRRSTWIGTSANIDSFGLTPKDTWLNCSPPYWLGGFTTLNCTILAGACAEVAGPGRSVEWILERLRAGGVTCIFLHPAMLGSITEMLEEMKRVELSVYEETVEMLRALRMAFSGSMCVSPGLRAAWREIRGKPVMVGHGMTESMGWVSVTDWRADGIQSPDDSCGLRRPQVSVKIADSGEICIKGPTLFTRYYSSKPDVMKEAFDSEGFYRTGDLGKLDNNTLYVLGRASHDMIRAGGYKIFAPQIEAALCNHPLISQAIVLGVPDESEGERVAAFAITKRKAFCKDSSECNPDTTKVDLGHLRRWLAFDQLLGAFQLPTLLRTVGSEADIPRTASSKPIKPRIKEVLFNQDELASGRIETWGLSREEPGIGQRAFDWEGRAA